MHTWVRIGIIGVGLACTAPVLAAPGAKPAQTKPAKPVAVPKDAAGFLRAANAASDAGKLRDAVTLADQGLALSPTGKTREDLLTLKARALVSLSDIDGAIAVWTEYLEIASPGNRRSAEAIIANLRAMPTLTITVNPPGSTDIYIALFDPKAAGVFCTAAPTCTKRIAPGRYKVLAERAGFQNFEGTVAPKKGEPAKLDIALTEKPSTLAVRVAQPNAVITIDGQPFDAATPVGPGRHKLVVSLANHLEETRDIEAHEGKPIELDIALTPLVPVSLKPAGVAATLTLDGKPVALVNGALPVPAGEHQLVVSAPGYETQPLPIPAEHGGNFSIVHTFTAHAVVVRQSPWTTKRKIAAGLGVAGVGVAVVGAVLGSKSKSLDDDAYKLCPSPSEPCADAARANKLNDDARSKATQANIAFGVGGALVASGVVLFIIGGPAKQEEQRISVAPRLGSVNGVDVSVRF